MLLHCSASVQLHNVPFRAPATFSCTQTQQAISKTKKLSGGEPLIRKKINKNIMWSRTVDSIQAEPADIVHKHTACSYSPHSASKI